MTDRSPPKWIKPVLELGPVLGFFVAYLMMKDTTYTFGGTEYDGFIVVTALFIPVLLAATALLWWITGTISRMQIFTAVLVVIFGGLSVWLNDDRFIKMKPTLVYLLIGGLLGVGLLRGQSYLQYVMGELMPLQDAGWMILTKRLAALFIGLAVVNEVVWRTMSTEMWVYIETFGFPVAIFGFFMAQAKLFDTYAVKDDAA